MRGLVGTIGSAEEDHEIPESGTHGDEVLMAIGVEVGEYGGGRSAGDETLWDLYRVIAKTAEGRAASRGVINGGVGGMALGISEDAHRSRSATAC